jgi:hypothetical protein
MTFFSAITASTNGGRIIADKPTLSYSGSGTSNNGKFRITDYSSGYVYTASGGTVSYDSGLGYWVFTVTDASGSGTLTARSIKSSATSSAITAYRQAAYTTPVFIATGSFACYGCAAVLPNTCCAPGPFGCGTYHATGFDYSGFWACGTPGYYNYPYANLSGSGYTWSGTDYTNGAGEWWKTV